jgi:putative spermidine/putrescine transport system ATP-binding protein
LSAELSLRAIAKRYEAAVSDAVADFNLEVTAGEFVTLLGPSGSGKTTVLKMIAGFERPTAGQILLGGKGITDLPPYRRGVGMVFQNYALFPHMTVFDNVAFPLAVRDRPRRDIADKVARGLQLVRLDGLAERYPAQLSGGQQQRVALARAVVFDPPLLLMDEPLGALDRNLRESMKAEIKRVQQALDITVIYVTHDQDEALAMSDRIAVMRDGRLVQIGTARELYDKPGDSFVARFIGESNLLTGRLLRRPDGTWVELGEGITVPVTEPAAEFPGSCLVMIRPERIRVRPWSGTPSEGWLIGRVTEAVFLGEATRYRIAVGPIELIVKHHNIDGRFFGVDDRVEAGWPAGAAAVLPR